MGEITGNRFTSESVNLLLVVSVVSSIVGIVFSNQLVAIFASGFTGETDRLTSFFVKVTFTYTAFSSIAGVLEAYFQYKGSFLPAIVSGYLLSGAVYAGDDWPCCTGAVQGSRIGVVTRRCRSRWIGCWIRGFGLDL